MNKSEQLRLLNIQNIATFIYIISLFISIVLTNYDKCNIEKTKPRFSPKTYRNTSIFNRVLVIVLTLTFLYVNYAGKKIAKRKGEKLTSFNLQIGASFLSLAATIIAFYVVLFYQDYGAIAGIENPNI